jgi:predicted house-cleaning noncanonical NTP pyrophosphatase (MazG superfamily)
MTGDEIDSDMEGLASGEEKEGPAKDGKREKKDKPASDDEYDTGSDRELAQEGEVDLRELAKEAKGAIEDMDSEERAELAEVVKGELEALDVDSEDLEAVKEAVKAGAEDALTEAFEALPEDAQAKVREGVEALKAAKEEHDGEDDGEGPEERKPKRGGDKQ